MQTSLPDFIVISSALDGDFSERQNQLLGLCLQCKAPISHTWEYLCWCLYINKLEYQSESHWPCRCVKCQLFSKGAESETFKNLQTTEHQRPRTFKMAIHLLIAALYSLSPYQTHTDTHTHAHRSGCTWHYFYQHCDESHQADQTASHHLCIITSIWLPHTKSGRKKAVNSWTVCSLCVSNTHFISVFCTLLDWGGVFRSVTHAKPIKVLKQVDT